MNENNAAQKDAASGSQATACPNCGSANVVKASVAYQMGTSTGSYGSVGIGAAGGELGVGLGGAGGRSTSEFAQRLAPPSSGSSDMGCAGMAALAVFIGIVWLFDPPSHSALWAVLTLGPAAAAYYYTYKHLASDHNGERAARQAQYDRLWVCLRCGQTVDKDAVSKRS